MRRPALVLFDLDGVLVHYDHAARVRELARRTGAGDDQVEQALFGSGLETAADAGEFDTAGFVDELARRLGVPVTLQDCIAARAASMQSQPEVVELASLAGRRAKLAILTNNGLLLREHFESVCPLLAPLFAGRVCCSAQFRMRKPEPEVFRQCVAQLGVAPADTLFFDDKPDNAKGARRAGLMAHTYRSPAGLRAHLADHQLLEPQA